MTESTDGMQWTRNVAGADGDLVAVQSDTTATLMLENLHGDLVAEANTSPTATGVTKTHQADEFGVPQDVGGGRFGWLGAMERRTMFADSGVISMGVRAYVPGLGRFTSPDPIPGGSANAYDYANQDPVNLTDPTGCGTLEKIYWCAAVCAGANCSLAKIRACTDHATDIKHAIVCIITACSGPKFVRCMKGCLSYKDRKKITHNGKRKFNIKTILHYLIEI
jgi:RHS repeat-associated protein